MHMCFHVYEKYGYTDPATEKAGDTCCTINSCLTSCIAISLPLFNAKNIS